MRSSNGFALALVTVRTVGACMSEGPDDATAGGVAELVAGRAPAVAPTPSPPAAVPFVPTPGDDKARRSRVVPPSECPPLVRGKPGALPQSQRIELGGRTLSLLLCPSGSSGAGGKPDVVWWEVPNTALVGLLVPHHNWDGGDGGDDIPMVGHQRVEALGPLADGAWGIVHFGGDEGWGNGSRTVWVVGPGDALSAPRTFSGSGPTWVEGGTLRAEDSDPNEASYEVAQLDARFRWQPPGWVVDGAPRLRTDLSTWPCEATAVPVLDPATGAPTGEFLPITREVDLEGLDYKEGIGGGPIFLIRAGARRAWVRQVAQSCAG